MTAKTPKWLKQIFVKPARMSDVDWLVKLIKARILAMRVSEMLIEHTAFGLYGRVHGHIQRIDNAIRKARRTTP